MPIYLDNAFSSPTSIVLVRFLGKLRKSPAVRPHWLPKTAIVRNQWPSNQTHVRPFRDSASIAGLAIISKPNSQTVPDLIVRRIEMDINLYPVYCLESQRDQYWYNSASVRVSGANIHMIWPSLSNSSLAVPAAHEITWDRFSKFINFQHFLRHRSIGHKLGRTLLYRIIFPDINSLSSSDGCHRDDWNLIPCQTIDTCSL